MDAQYDGIAGIDYRAKVSPMAGYYLIKTDKMTLAVEGAPPSLVSTFRPGGDTYWAARFAERFNYKLTAVHSSLGVTRLSAQVSDWTANYLLIFETGIGDGQSTSIGPCGGCPGHVCQCAARPAGTQ